MAYNPNPCFKLTVRMQRDSPNIRWGFRMQGGADFNNLPLSVQTITPGSLAEEVGLQPGDIITAIGDPPNPAMNWTHAEAEQVIRQCMDYLVLTIQRGGSAKTWEIGRSAGADLPSSGNYALNQRNNAASSISAALPTQSKWGGPAQSQQNYGGSNDSYVQHSLAANKQDWNPVGSSHNRSARPFGSGGSYGGGPENSLAGTLNNASPIIHNPYNSPMGLYSAQNASDAYNAQSTALLAGRPSPTMKAVQQVEQFGDFAGSFGQSAAQAGPTGYGGSSYGGRPGGTSPAPGGYRPVQAPSTMSPDHYQQPVTQVPKCSACQSGIVGVFVRVRGQPMCVSCYKCARCGIPLKTIGHFIVEDQLYCEQHAKQMTRPGYGGFESRTVYS
ncbi:PDZ and LIM domain protein 3-like isoform X2 [Paramacrobiotus metropolitanus]|uniref:PDZ and LIM domain protein 3-like isoform X2 n=1 Tax=Paramacrobiotus metropolitanus TaxID=2943436 RepID=UPI00244639FB|nr:PDZ and LIM domain protein 3-like isoform X2 [Paramacrobiotus metropolitanus]